MRRLAELASELAAEVRRRELRGARERLYVERITVARVDEVLRAEQVTCGMWGEHCREYAPRSVVSSVERALVESEPSGSIGADLTPFAVCPS